MSTQKRFGNVGAQKDASTAQRVFSSLEAAASDSESAKKQPARKKTGDARKSARVCLLITPDMLEAVDAAAKADNRSRNAWIGMAIAEKLDRDTDR